MLGRLRQEEYYEFKVSLGYNAGPCLKKTNKQLSEQVGKRGRESVPQTSQSSVEQRCHLTYAFPNKDNKDLVKFGFLLFSF